jgi:hypothetical protein
MLRKEREGWGTRPECLPRHPSAAEAIRTVVTLAARLEVVPFPIHHPQDNKAGAACAVPLQSQKQRARAPAPHHMYAYVQFAAREAIGNPERAAAVDPTLRKEREGWGTRMSLGFP